MTVPDHLAEWQEVREQVAWRDIVPHVAGPVRALRDGFADYARGTADRGPERLHGLLNAHGDVRDAVATGTALTPELLARWNRITLDVPVAEFRRGPAYAKNGRERYGLLATTPQRFATCLANADETATPVAARAARIYLDVAFFHPHNDGNARLAALVLQFVLLREHVELDDVAPILSTMRRADDAGGAADLARLLHGMAAASHRRWLRASLDSTEPASHGAAMHRPSLTGGWRVARSHARRAGSPAIHRRAPSR